MSLSPADASFVRTLARTHAAIHFSEQKEYLIEARLAPVAHDAGASTISELLGRMRDGSADELHERVIDALTTHETSWFRDRHPFDTLREHVLPQLIESRSLSKVLTIWCAAASTGQEPYSLAMMLREQLPQLSSWRVRILATDISRVALDKARSGLYSQLEINRGLPAHYLARYFTREGTHFRLNECIRSMVEFRQHNLDADWSVIPRSDVVLMRNVMIYFEHETKVAVLDKLTTVLRPDGALLLGAAETTLGLSATYERVQRGAAGWYRLKA